MNRAKKSLIGAGLVGLGLTIMMLSPYAALHLSIVTRVAGYTAMFLVGFISVLYGTGLVLLANNLWGH